MFMILVGLQWDYDIETISFNLGALRNEATLRDLYKKATKMWGPQDVLHYLFSHQNDIQNAKTIGMILQHSLWLVTGKTHI